MEQLFLRKIFNQLRNVLFSDKMYLSPLTPIATTPSNPHHHHTP